MAEKHLRDLLKEDQEPFLLKHYITERRRQLKKPSPNSTLLKNKPKKNIPLNKCFLSLHNATKSPLLEFISSSSPNKIKSPLRPSNAKTATLLLEAALRIQKHPNAKPNKAFGINNLLGSFFKRLAKPKREIEAVKESGDEVGSTCSCNGRHSSAVWSESTEDKSLDMETCSSGAHSFDDSVEEIHFLNKPKHKNHHSLSFHHDYDGFFCQSPFRFSLQRSPDFSGRRTPEFSSPPPPSPPPPTTQDKEINGVDGVNKFQSGEEEEDKEQCSPVSVLDLPFHYEDDDENYHGEIGFDLDCSYANVQRTKHHLLDRLCRFEKLAELDPVELEKRMLDQEDHEYETFIEDDDYEDMDSETTCEEKAVREEVFEILCHSRVHNIQHPPEDLKRLVYDLIMEEETQAVNSAEERNMVIKRVLKRLELWKEVESNTIDMMIQEDFSREEGKWKKNADKTKELVVELEVAIFCLLVDELSEELLC